MHQLPLKIWNSNELPGIAAGLCIPAECLRSSMTNKALRASAVQRTIRSMGARRREGAEIGLKVIRLVRLNTAIAGNLQIWNSLELPGTAARLRNIAIYLSLFHGVYDA